MDSLSAIFITMTLHFNLPPELLSSLCYVESTHSPTAIHHDDKGSDSIGLCQIKYKTAKSLGYAGTPEQLLEPATNAYFSAMYLQKQIKRYHGNVTKGVIAYNKGNAKNLTSSKYQRKVFNIWPNKK